MLIHLFKCNKCGFSIDAKYNGEHYLPPKGWTEIIDCHEIETVGHLCKQCTNELCAPSPSDLETAFE